jgi:hypothetical protein
MWLTVGTIAFFGGTTNQKCSTIPKPRGKKPNAARWCAESATACFEVMRLANEVIDDALFRDATSISGRVSSQNFMAAFLPKPRSSSQRSRNFFAQNQIDRYSLGTKNKDLVHNNDGSLTIYETITRDPRLW